MAFFRNGSEISMPLLMPSNSPLNAKEVADSVAQVLSDLPVDERYVGQAIFCEAENKLFRFTKHDNGMGGLTSGVEDSDFRQDESSGNTETYFTTTSPITNKIGQLDLDEEYSETDMVTINEVLNRLLHTNIEPEIEFELVNCDNILEQGQSIPNPKLRLVFTKVGNSTITNINFYKDGVALGSEKTFTDGVLEYIETDTGLTSDTEYSVIVTYNFGKGNKTIEKKIDCKFVKRSFYGTTNITDFTLDNDTIRALSNNKLGLKTGDEFELNIEAGDKEVIIAYPKELGDISSIKYVQGMNAEIKGVFTKQIVQVKDIGTTLSDYNVYTYKPINPYLSNCTYMVTI